MGLTHAESILESLRFERVSFEKPKTATCLSYPVAVSLLDVSRRCAMKRRLKPRCWGATVVPCFWKRQEPGTLSSARAVERGGSGRPTPLTSHKR